MATNHHHHHHQCHCLPTPSTTTTTTCYCTLCTTTLHHPLPPPPPSPDPLIHSIYSHHHHHPPPQTHHNLHQYPQIHQNHHVLPTHYHHQVPQQTPPPQQLTPTVSSLIHRISALETTLRRRNHSQHPTTLRHAAARTIQTHFRSFLVRRSTTLRHLKHLAYIKSSLNHLKSSVSNKPHFDPHFVSQQSVNLLTKLDSIQGSDPMIRDGKQSISRDLIRFMEVIDGMCKESEVITVKNVRFGQKTQTSKKSGDSVSRVLGYSGRKFVENLKNQRKCVGEMRIGGLTKSQGKSQREVKKNVRFDEDGNVYRLFKSSDNQAVLSGGSGSSGSSNGDDEDEEVVVEEIGVCSKEPEVEESSEMSGNEMDPRKNLSARVHHLTKNNQQDQEDDDNDEEDDIDEDEDDSFVFSAPLPAKMEY